MFWKIYAVAFVTLNSFSLIDYVTHPFKHSGVAWAGEILVMPLAVVGLYGYAFKRSAWFPPKAWRSMFIFYGLGTAAELLSVVQTTLAGPSMKGPVGLLAVLIFLGLSMPALYALYRNGNPAGRPTAMPA